jgi:glyoxalase/bleomycin resistance protein/dioxygenase superfamily protein/SnoaL-like protein
MAAEGELQDPRAATVEILRAAFCTHDLSALATVLAPGVRWYGHGPGSGCRGREEVLATLRRRFDAGPPQLHEARLAGDHAVLRIGLSGEGDPRWYALALDEHGLIGELQGYGSEASLQHDLAILADAAPAPAPPPAPVSRLVPFVHVADMHRSVAFYALLGFAVQETFEPGGELAWAFLQTGDARLMLAGADPPIGHRQPPVLFYLYAHDLPGLRDHLVAQRAAPGEIVDGTPGPSQEMRVTDPDGYVLMIAQIEPDP